MKIKIVAALSLLISSTAIFATDSGPMMIGTPPVPMLDNNSKVSPCKEDDLECNLTDADIINFIIKQKEAGALIILNDSDDHDVVCDITKKFNFTNISTASFDKVEYPCDINIFEE